MPGCGSALGRSEQLSWFSVSPKPSMLFLDPPFLSWDAWSYHLACFKWNSLPPPFPVPLLFSPFWVLLYPLSHSVQPRQKETACHSRLSLHHQPQHPRSCASNQRYLVEWLLCTWHCPGAWDVRVNKQAHSYPQEASILAGEKDH